MTGVHFSYSCLLSAGMTPLIIACACGHTDVVKALIDHACSLAPLSSKSNACLSSSHSSFASTTVTATSRAAASSLSSLSVQPPAIKEYLDLVTRRGNSAVHCASRFPQILKILLQVRRLGFQALRPLPPSFQSFTQKNPFSLTNNFYVLVLSAVMTKVISSVSAPVLFSSPSPQKGANPTLVNREGHTALEIAMAKNVPTSVRVLKVRNEDVKQGRNADRAHSCHSLHTETWVHKNRLPSPPLEISAGEGVAAGAMSLQGACHLRRLPRPPTHVCDGQDPC